MLAQCAEAAGPRRRVGASLPVGWVLLLGEGGGTRRVCTAAEPAPKNAPTGENEAISGYLI